MSYDIAFRIQQALDPSALVTVAAGLNVLVRAIDECQRIRADPESDPAVLLLARHLGNVAAENGPSQSDLRRACIEAVGAVERTPLLVTLAQRGVSYDSDAKAAFHAEARKAMKRLAKALGLERNEIQVRSNMAGIACSGEIILHSAHVYIQLDLGCMGPGHEVMFRSCEGLKDYVGGRNHFASVEELVAPGRLAERIRRELRLPQSEAAATQLIV
ncbi:MAG: hypothetical protein ACR2PC_08020 [Tsuneonella suprasediminis]